MSQRAARSRSAFAFFYFTKGSFLCFLAKRMQKDKTIIVAEKVKYSIVTRSEFPNIFINVLGNSGRKLRYPKNHVMIYKNLKGDIFL